MKTHRESLLNFQIVLPALLALIIALPGLARCDSLAIELLLQQSPASGAGGVVSPASGLHRFAVNSQVALKAAPQPGYQFACWLGDVANPISPETVVRLNNSKIIVAVFVPVDFDMPADQYPFAAGGGSARGGMIPTAINFGAPAFSAPSGARPNSFSFPAAAAPVPVPEPATLLLVASGALLIRRRT